MNNETSSPQTGASVSLLLLKRRGYRLTPWSSTALPSRASSHCWRARPNLKTIERHDVCGVWQARYGPRHERNGTVALSLFLLARFWHEEIRTYRWLMAYTMIAPQKPLLFVFVFLADA